LTDPLQQALHNMWSAVAQDWHQPADEVDCRAAVVTQAMLEAADPQPGARVLELACGPGGVGLSAAAIAGPAGEVVCSDVAPQMTAIAADRADARNLANVRSAQIDMENIDFPDASFDAVFVARA
jgi:ubiquinone/menaquinone biosynthesis C-methylase UbiE